MIDIKGFDSSLLKTYKKSQEKKCGITIKKVDDYENIYSVNPLHLMIGKVIGHIEEYNGNKCLISKNTKKYKKVLKSIKKYTELWDEIKKKIENKNDGECNSVE